MNSRPSNCARSSTPEPVELLRLADDHELRRLAVEPVQQRPHDVELDVLERRVRLGLGRHARDVELVVDVAVEPVPRLDDRADRLARKPERDPYVSQELAARRIHDGGALVADDRLGAGRYGRTDWNIRPVTTTTSMPCARAASSAARVRGRRTKSSAISVRSRSQASAATSRGKPSGSLRGSSGT